MPGKLQKQSTQVVRKNTNPLFEHEVMFDDLSYEEVLRMRLRMKVSKTQSEASKVQQVVEGKHLTYAEYIELFVICSLDYFLQSYPTTHLTHIVHDTGA